MNEEDRLDHNRIRKAFNQLNENDQNLIIFLYEWGRPIRPGLAAEELDIKHSTLNLVLDRLKQENIVSWEKYKDVQLLSRGKEMAAHQLNHHEVIHQYLVDYLDLSDDEAHEESVRVAGIFSCKTVEKMKLKLNSEYKSNCSLFVSSLE